MTKKVVLYGADWCAPCQAFKPHFKGVSVGYLNQYMGVDFEYQDVDEMTPEQIAETGIQSVPTVVLYIDDKPHIIESRTADKFAMEVEHLISK